MKKIISLVIIILLLFCGCSALPDEEPQEIYDVTENGITYTVDTINKTITDNATGCEYKYSAGDTTEITYPDGSTYWWKTSELGGYGGWSDDYDPEKYTDGDILISILEHEIPVKKVNKDDAEATNILFGILFAALGVFNAAKPEKAWYMSVGWKIKNAELSDTAIGYYRASGIFLVIMGLWMMFV